MLIIIPAMEKSSAIETPYLIFEKSEGLPCAGYLYPEIERGIT
jgi:hypothetical protein